LKYFGSSGSCDDAVLISKATFQLFMVEKTIGGAITE
jgi:hypothetical protein